MRMAVKEIRSLQRGIAVLDMLSRIGACSLAELSRATGLPKSTLRRILGTFEASNFVRRSLTDGLYRANVHFPSRHDTAANPFTGRIVAAATPVLEELAAKVVWPSDVLIRDEHHLRIIETNRSLSPLLINRSEIGDRVDMLNSAVGRAYLAFCPQPERDEIGALLTAVHGAEATARTLRALEETRLRGYGLRDAAFTGSTARHPMLTDRLFAIAVPVMFREHVICCINMLWPRAAVGMSEIGDLADMLKVHARRIAANYQRQPRLTSTDGEAKSTPTQQAAGARYS